jgi:hypothetical protein
MHTLCLYRAVPLLIGVFLLGLLMGRNDREAQAAVPCGQWACQSYYEYAPDQDTCWRHYVVQAGKKVARLRLVLPVWDSGNINNEEGPIDDQKSKIKRDVYAPTLHCNNVPAVFPQRAECTGDPTQTDLEVNYLLCTKIDPAVRIVQPIVNVPKTD